MQGGREESHIGRTPNLEVRKQDHRLKLCCLLLALVPGAIKITWRSCRNDEKSGRSIENGGIRTRLRIGGRYFP